MTPRARTRLAVLLITLLAGAAAAMDTAPAASTPSAAPSDARLAGTDSAEGTAPSLTPAAMPGATDGTVAMREAMTTYFDKEHRTGLFATGLGLATVGTGIGLFAAGGGERQGAGVTMMVMGALQLAIGLGLTLRTPAQVKRLDAQLTDAPATYAAEERARLAKVNSRWWLYRAVEVSVAFSGIVVAGVGGVTNSDAAVGVGLALVGEALVMLLIDHFAEERARAYEAALLGFHF